MKPILGRLFASVALLLCPIAVPFSAYALEVTTEPENIVSSRLEGRWEISLFVSSFLGRNLPTRTRPIIKFTSDNSIVDQLPQSYRDEILVDRTIYMAGKMAVEGDIYPFVLIELQGNPHMIFFEEQNGDPFGRAESLNVMLVPGEEEEQDLLFIGGDFNNQQFIGFVRSPFIDPSGAAGGSAPPESQR
ncbi:MAG: hypothetical protein AAF685_11545 [Cyanobacteria bacterium P01_C01_bin.89]